MPGITPVGRIGGRPQNPRERPAALSLEAVSRARGGEGQDPAPDDQGLVRAKEEALFSQAFPKSLPTLLDRVGVPASPDTDRMPLYLGAKTAQSGNT